MITENLDWWKSRLSHVDEILGSVKNGQTGTLCKSAGGRHIRMVAYGERLDYKRRANYNSACGAHDIRHYADKTGAPPVILLIGAIHAQELEGTVALLNLINIIETGCDCRGEESALGELIEQSGCRLIIIPVMNPDGRARCEPDSMVGLTNEQLRHWGQGRWTDGALCGWPGCKSVHPIKDAVSFLGAYYNDDGVNFMHDNFFGAMATETAALLRLAEDEAADYIILLHGGSNCTNVLLQPNYVPPHVRAAVRALALRTAELSENADLPSSVLQISDDAGAPPPSFNLASAIHHICGGVCAVYESNQGLLDKNSYDAETILRLHYMLFEGVIREADDKIANDKLKDIRLPDS